MEKNPPCPSWLTQNEHEQQMALQSKRLKIDSRIYKLYEEINQLIGSGHEEDLSETNKKKLLALNKRLRVLQHESANLMMKGHLIDQAGTWREIFYLKRKELSDRELRKLKELKKLFKKYNLPRPSRPA